jgi:hypothetical protein
VTYGGYMAVKKKISPATENYIDKGADVKSCKDNKSFKNVLIRIPTSILTQLDNIVEKKPWINRTQWIVEAINYKIKNYLDEEKENII